MILSCVFPFKILALISFFLFSFLSFEHIESFDLKQIMCLNNLRKILFSRKKYFERQNDLSFPDLTSFRVRNRPYLFFFFFFFFFSKIKHNDSDELGEHYQRIERPRSALSITAKTRRFMRILSKRGEKKMQQHGVSRRRRGEGTRERFNEVFSENHPPRNGG